VLTDARSLQDEVLVIDGQKAFDSTVKLYDFMVIEFYAPVRVAPARRPPDAVAALHACCAVASRSRSGFAGLPQRSLDGTRPAH
jgi:hypothetical protein